MEENLKKEIVEMLQLIQRARKYSEPFNSAKLFELCQEMISKQVWLIAYLLDSETKYREKILEIRNNVKTKADAEIQAKVTQEYKDYKFIEYSYTLVEEQIKLIKKFASHLAEEREKSSLY